MAMHWDRLISDLRFGMEDYIEHRSEIRSDFQRDYDRLIFSSSFRRLQNKTQVFPLPGSIFVHNRLTHSLEVAGVGRSIATEVAKTLMSKYSGEPWTDKLMSLSEIVAAACLAHDLGNPPFGHSGEKCIGTFFSEGQGQELAREFTREQWLDLINFEGNANSLRLLTHSFNGRRRGGFAMTYSMLASIVKYPFSSAYAGTKGKFGFFTSERESYARIAEHLGLLSLGPDRYARHPLVYIVEAADDICYQIMDIEDAHKLKILSTREAIELLLGFFDYHRQEHITGVMQNIGDKNEKIAYLRSCVIGELVKEAAAAFLTGEQEMLAGTYTGCIIDHIGEQARRGYEACTRVAYSKIYCAANVVDIELAGNRIITFLMEKLIEAVRYPERNYSQLLLNKFPEQYEVNAPTLFGKIQAVIDHVSGMTDVYALDLYRKLHGMSLPAV